jgi:hypothetical protein
MKLEHRKQKIVPFSTFLVRLGRYAIFAMLLIIFSVFIGMIGYHYFGQLTWLDSFHMSCMILTGMGPVVEMKTDGAKIFSPIVHRLLHILQVEKDEND